MIGSDLADHGGHVTGWRRWALALTVLGVAIAATACSASSKASAPSPATSPAAAGGGGGGTSSSGAGGAGGGAAPAAFGTAAALSPGSLEVQNPTTGQTTVTYTGATMFSQTQTVSRSALAVGLCAVAVGGTRPAGSTGSTPAAPSSPAAPPTGPVSFTATTIMISQPVNGSCATAGFGGTGTRPSGSPRTFPSRTFPSGSRAPGAGFGAGERAAGKITAVNGSTLTVQADRRSGAAVNDTVTVAATTTLTETVRATSSALKVGQCVTAIGSTNSAGAVAATRIAISNPGPNGCTQRFGRGGFGGGTTSGG